MAKKYTVKQTLMFRGNKITNTFVTPFIDESVLQSMLGLLEGGYEVVEKNDALSNMTKAETAVTNTMPIKTITLSGEKRQKEFVSAYGGETIHFKNSVSEDDIVGLFSGKKVFEFVPDAAVLAVGVKTGPATLS
jgi:hypothetical protein